MGRQGDAFVDESWRATLGGVHVILWDRDRIVSHGAVIERWFELEEKPLQVDYVEAVATIPERQGEGPPHVSCVGSTRSSTESSPLEPSTLQGSLLSGSSAVLVSDWRPGDVW
jgi:hypothetical protein